MACETDKGKHKMKGKKAAPKKPATKSAAKKKGPAKAAKMPMMPGMKKKMSGY